MTSADALDLTTAAIITTDLADLCRRVDELGSQVDALWRGALESGDFNVVDRCAAAGQALHRAAFALRSDSVLGP